MLTMFHDYSYGYLWHCTVSNLVKFDFRFSLIIDPNIQYNYATILAPYTTLFWLEYKRWFVACDMGKISPVVFTIPRFAPDTTIWPHTKEFIHCTSSNIDLQQNIHCLVWTLQLNLDLFVSSKITSLILVRHQDFSTQVLNSMMDLPQKLPNLVSLTLCQSLLNYLPSKLVLDRIQSLTIYNDHHETNPHGIIDVHYLSKVFPGLKKINTPVQGLPDVYYLLDHMKYLSFAVFHNCFDHSSFPKKLLTDTILRYWLICNNYRLWINPSFSNRIIRQSLFLCVSISQNKNYSICIHRNCFSYLMINMSVTVSQGFVLSCYKILYYS